MSIPAKNTNIPPTTTWIVESTKLMRKYRQRMKEIANSSKPTTPNATYSARFT